MKTPKELLLAAIEQLDEKSEVLIIHENSETTYILTNMLLGRLAQASTLLQHIVFTRLSQTVAWSGKSDDTLNTIVKDASDA